MKQGDTQCESIGPTASDSLGANADATTMVKYVNLGKLFISQCLSFFNYKMGLVS